MPEPDDSWVKTVTELATVCVGVVLLAAAIAFLGKALNDTSDMDKCLEEGSAVIDGKRYICVEYKLNE